MEESGRDFRWFIVCAVIGGIGGFVVGLAVDQWAVQAGVVAPARNIPLGSLLAGGGLAAGAAVGFLRVLIPMFRNSPTKVQGPEADFDELPP